MGVWYGRVGALCGGMGVVEGHCCFCVVERLLEGRSEFESVLVRVLVVEFVDVVTRAAYM